MTSQKLTRLIIGGLVVAATISTGSIARADFVVLDFNGDHLIRRGFTLAPNEFLTAQTTGCASGSDDTVIFILEGNKFVDGNMKTVAFNDDDGFSGTFCSFAVFQNTTGVTKDYTVLVTTFNRNSPTNVTLLLQQTPNPRTSESVTVGGITHRYGGNGLAETVQVVPSRATVGGHSVDSVLYLIDPTIGGPAHFDDDHGFAFLSKTTNLDCTNKTCWLVAGDFSEGTAGGNLEIWAQGSTPDSDHDGISDGVEDALASFNHLPAGAKTKADADGDGLTDFEELVGVADPAGLAGGDASLCMPWQDTGPDPSQQDLFVEVDFMVPSPATHTHDPRATTNWNTFAADVTSTFQSDSGFTGRTIIPHIMVDQSIAETNFLSFGNSCAAADTTAFLAVKNNRSFFDPLRAAIFHYMIIGHRHKAANCSVLVASGEAEIWGNDVMLTPQDALTGATGTVVEQHGTFVHEVGHNLSLAHFGNGNNPLVTGPNSCVHSSLMNYRYQITGWGNASIPASRRFGYSNGLCPAVANGCANTCSASHCVPSGQASPKQGCGTNNGSCDCDRGEWALVNLDIPANGLMTFVVCQVGTCNGGAGGMGDLSRSYFMGDARRYGPIHRKFAEARRDKLRTLGLVEGVDFAVHPETGHLYSIE